MWENDCYRLATYIKIDTGNHLQNIRSMQFNEQLAWKATGDMFLEIHYAYIHGRSIVPDSPWRWQHRLELEANPQFHLPCNSLIKTRNRLEIRRVQTEPKILYRLRQRTMLFVPIENRRSLKAFSVYNELFYSLSTYRITQDRICFCQFAFSLNKKVNLDVFFIMRFLRSDNIWRRSAVVGTQVVF